MTDKELLTLAAKAAGIELDWDIPPNSHSPWRITGEGDDRGPASEWNPLQDDGDALRLAVKLSMDVDCCDNGNEASHSWAMSAHPMGAGCLEYHADDPYAATRRAIVRAAAEIGKEMK